MGNETATDELFRFDQVLSQLSLTVSEAANATTVVTRLRKRGLLSQEPVAVPGRRHLAYTRRDIEVIRAWYFVNGDWGHRSGRADTSPVTVRVCTFVSENGWSRRRGVMIPAGGGYLYLPPLDVVLGRCEVAVDLTTLPGGVPVSCRERLPAALVSH